MQTHAAQPDRTPPEPPDESGGPAEPGEVRATRELTPDDEQPMSIEAEINPASAAAAARPVLGFWDRIEASIARLSTRSNFWHRVCSLIWLPYAFRSGITMKRLDETTFAAELPFRRFNRNWYNAMAGAALLGNSEIAGGMYVFGACGGAYTVVCKELSYRFMLPCFGPALYKIYPRENMADLVASGKEFNITVDMDVVQRAVLTGSSRKPAKDRTRSLIARLAQRERRVGRVTAVFHLTPHEHHKTKRGHIRNVG
ncbi:MAG: hypothetical protein HRU70_13620 [Phycisphaeraceae bacterium]|nr:MAG: hypothetical protein HRU70_13620 [Phycisphaeraceae bacterium]